MAKTSAADFGRCEVKLTLDRMRSPLTRSRALRMATSDGQEHLAGGGQSVAGG